MLIKEPNRFIGGTSILKEKSQSEPKDIENTTHSDNPIELINKLKMRMKGSGIQII